MIFKKGIYYLFYLLACFKGLGLIICPCGGIGYVLGLGCVMGQGNEARRRIVVVCVSYMY